MFVLKAVLERFEDLELLLLGEIIDLRLDLMGWFTRQRLNLALH